MTLKELVKELKENNKLDSINRARLVALKQLWLKEQEGKCVKCGRTENLTLDHVIPVRIINEMGIEESKTYMPENYRVLCRICNQFKGDRLDFSEKKTKELLIKYLETL